MVYKHRTRCSDNRTLLISYIQVNNLIIMWDTFLNLKLWWNFFSPHHISLYLKVVFNTSYQPFQPKKFTRCFSRIYPSIWNITPHSYYISFFVKMSHIDGAHKLFCLMVLGNTHLINIVSNQNSFLFLCFTMLIFHVILPIHHMLVCKGC